MENPSTWKRAELIIDSAIREHERMMRQPDAFCGASLTHLIAEKLRRNHILHDEILPEIGWDRLRKYHDEEEEKDRLE